VGFRLIAYAAAGAHFAFLAFGLFGGFLAWRWPRLIWVQLTAAGWLVLVAAAHLACPLTWIEDRARERAGLAPTPGGFIATHVAGVFYPRGQQHAALAVTAAIVLISWIGFAILRGRGRARRPRPPAGIPSRAHR
jgi:Protein of Unknown function (DUF2784)